MADINIHQAGALKVTVKEFCPYDKPARFATLSLHNDRDDVTLFFAFQSPFEDPGLSLTQAMTDAGKRDR